MTEDFEIHISRDNLSRFQGETPGLVTFGEVMIRDTPADMERPERTRLVHLSPAGSEFTLAIGLSRLGIRSSFITRVPANAYGYSVRNTGREQGVDTRHFVWAPATEPIGRLIYELGRTPRRNSAVYQRMGSAASKLGRGMVDWKTALAGAALFHISGITFGLADHSGYETNYNLEAFREAVAAKPSDCLIGLDMNFRATLWGPERAREVIEPVLGDDVDILMTTVEDVAALFGLGVGGYSAAQIKNGEMGDISDDDIRSFAREVMEMFDLRALAVTIRYPDSFEQHRWESAAVTADGAFFRSPSIRSITLLDRLGGGDTWNAGFYYGILTEGLTPGGIRKGVLVGDAFTRLKQTAMFDLPIIDKREVEALLVSDVQGGGKRTER